MAFNQKILFTREECDLIIENHINLPIARKEAHSHMGYTYRNVNYKEYQWIVNRFINWIEEQENCKVNWVNENSSEFYFQSYEVGDKFNKHDDNINDRYYTAGLLLNDTFDGGEFIVDVINNTSIQFKKNIGNCYFFESNMEHELKEIVSGNRNIILIFFHKKNIKFNQHKFI